jgi:hypothetical protein
MVFFQEDEQLKIKIQRAVIEQNTRRALEEARKYY